MFSILALDHRTSLLKNLSEENLVTFKQKILNVLGPLSSDLLLDTKYGLTAYKKTNLKKPLILAIEKSGTVDSAGERTTELEHTVKEVKNLKADTVKLLIYFNPNAVSAEQQIKLVTDTAKECKNNNLPFLLEIIPYKLPQQSDINITIYCKALIDRLKSDKTSIDTFKLPFPGSPEKCREITETVNDTSWVLLSGGDDFDTFLNNYKVARQNGCGGFAAGRALWQEAVDLPKDDWEKFFTDTAKVRLARLCRVSTNYAITPPPKHSLPL